MKNPLDVLTKWVDKAALDTMSTGRMARHRIGVEPTKMQKPGQFYQEIIPQADKDVLKELKSDDLKNIRLDAIKFWC